MNVPRDVFARLALLGILLILGASATYSVAVLMADPAQIAFELFIWVPALVCGAAIWFWRRWGLVAGVLVGCVAMLLFVSEAELGITAPDSFFDFVPMLLALTGGLTLLLASLAGTVQYFRGRVRDDAGLPAGAVLGVGVVLAIAALGSAILTAASVDDVSADDAEGAIVITAEGVEWEMDLIEVEAGQPVKLLVRNKDPFLHTFTVYDLDIDERIGPWSEKLIEIDGFEPRIYGFICQVEGHEEDMTGAIVAE